MLRRALEEAQNRGRDVLAASEKRATTANERLECGAEVVGSFCSGAASTSRPRVNGPVLPEIAEGYRRSRWWVSHEIAKIFRAANIETSVKLEGRRTRTPEATFHSLRHTFVSLAANAGVPLHIVQSIVGHESTAMTRHYYHESAEALRQAVAAIPDLGEPERDAPGAGGRLVGPGMTQGQLDELAKIYSQLKRIFEPE